MTTIITRLYADEATAKTVMSALEAERHNSSTLDIISGSQDLAERMKTSPCGR